ncbi:polysaccharide biosynthesis/export family protein [Rubrivivax albus]|uniref:Polysialic acid transporter n=1 Tax=Rubrivivax albus TaxID=2499835 RepID=A0A3S2U0Z3_9BURK|nr:polysaccharide biosynthesis/export family protein [Rubrivivax albus]RVT49456.1 polysialic acid transporter [Rubrivivax albus]
MPHPRIAAFALAWLALAAGPSTAQVVQPSAAATAPLALPTIVTTPAPTQAAPPHVALPMPPDPGRTPGSVMFGSQIFSGRFASEAFSGFNPDYQIAVGDRLSVRLWGGFNLDATLAVDAQGNIFIPNVGPVHVAGVRNGELNGTVEARVKRTFRASVGVYATLEAAQPVKVYVTGFVRAPGLYAGLSSDSVLYYLDRAGGIDPARGSHLQVDVLRSGKPRARIDLYRFLLEGHIDTLQLRDGDSIVVAPRKHTVQVSGEVMNPYAFEFEQREIAASDLMALARPKPGATHLSIVRKIGADRRSEYHALARAAGVMIQDGDDVTFTSDKYPGTILVRLEGAHLGERSLVLPYGARLKDALQRLVPAPQANVAALQLYRKSVAQRQKDLLDTSLRGLETYALTARSATSEEAVLRQREGDAILKFVERARMAQPRGQVVLANAANAGETLLEDGDVISVPETSNVVLVGGEVMVPNALVFAEGEEILSYIRRAGGYTQGADEARVIIIRQDGTVVEALPSASTVLRAGDELMVLPKIETKNIEVTRGITQIIYQIAVAAKVVFGL